LARAFKCLKNHTSLLREGRAVGELAEGPELVEDPEPVEGAESANRSKILSLSKGRAGKGESPEGPLFQYLNANLS
jgi:hypothetical protein